MKHVLTSGKEAYVAVFAHASKGFGENRRIRSFYAAKGVLPRDAQRLPSALAVAFSILSATEERDLLPEEEWRREQWILHPIMVWN